MFDLSKKIGVKSYSFRDIKDNEKCAEMILSCKSNTVDLSGTHVNYDDPDSWEKVIAIYRNHGIDITGIGVVTVKPDDAWNRRYFEFCHAAGGKVVTITFAIDNWEMTIKSVEKLSEEYGIPTAIHNHGGFDWLGNSTTLNYLFRHSSNRIGLCLDTAWCIHTERENPVDWMERFADRIYGFHFKDFFWDRNGIHTDCIVGTGALNLPAVLEKFKEMEHIQSAVLEYEGPDAMNCTAKSIANIRALCP